MPDETLDRPAWEPWKRLGTEQYRRRYALYALAAPVLERHGYRGSTIRALAHACHLSPAGLLHHFGSKRALATYPLHAPRLGWDTVHVEPGADPLHLLDQLLEMAVRNVPLYLIALRLDEEINGPSDPSARAEAFREGEVVFGRLIQEAAPGLSRETAVGIGRDVLAALVGSAWAGFDADFASGSRARMIELLRGRLVPDAVDADRFDRVFGER